MGGRQLDFVMIGKVEHIYLTLSACAEGYRSLSVCMSLAGYWRQHHFDTQNKHQCMFYSCKKTDFCVNLFIPSEKATVIAAALYSIVAMVHTCVTGARACKQHCFDV